MKLRKISKKIKEATELAKLYVGGMVAGAENALNSTTSDGIGVSILDVKEQGSSLMNALKNHQINQEVKMLRYRTYLIESESYKYAVTSGSEYAEAKIIDPDFCKPSIYEDDEYKTLLVQDTTGLTAGIKDTDIPESGKMKDLKLKTVGILYMERENTFYSRHFTEDYTKMLALKEHKESHELLLELYFDNFPDMYEVGKRNHTIDVEKFYINKRNPKCIDEFKTIAFTTDNRVWNSKHHIYRKFQVNDFVDIKKWHTFFIIRYNVNIIEQKDELEEYFSPEMQRNYNERLKRPKAPFNPFNLNDIKMESCEVCGKEMSSENLEIADYRLTKSTIGIGMCANCYKNYLKNLEDNDKSGN
jgi:hypothetical protein